MTRGKFITLYGINNIGKSTHARKLVERLKQSGHEVVYLKYPIYDLEPTGPELNRILRGDQPQKINEEQLQTLFMQNRQDFEPELRQMLDEGKIVVAEDYTGTGIAWGMAKGVDQKWLETLNAPLLKEDFAILLTGKRDLRARETQHLHEQNDELVQKVADILLHLAKTSDWKIIQTQTEINETAKIIWETIRSEL